MTGSNVDEQSDFDKPGDVVRGLDQMLDEMQRELDDALIEKAQRKPTSRPTIRRLEAALARQTQAPTPGGRTAANGHAREDAKPPPRWSGPSRSTSSARPSWSAGRP